jgi:hypothetical protein
MHSTPFFAMVCCVCFASGEGVYGIADSGFWRILKFKSALGG